MAKLPSISIPHLKVALRMSLVSKIVVEEYSTSHRNDLPLMTAFSRIKLTRETEKKWKKMSCILFNYDSTHT